MLQGRFAQGPATHHWGTYTMKRFTRPFLLCAIIFGFACGPNARADVIDSSGTGFSFADNDPSGATSVITIGVDEIIDDVQIDLFGLDHTWVGDLTARIISPNGTTADLFVRVGPGRFGDASNLDGNYSFADNGADFASAAASVGGGQTIAEGLYRAAGDNESAVSLATTFAGESTQGDWTLFISDNARFDLGSFDGWGLSIASDSSVSSVPEPGAATFCALVACCMLCRRSRRTA